MGRSGGTAPRLGCLGTGEAESLTSKGHTEVGGGTYVGAGVLASVRCVRGRVLPHDYVPTCLWASRRGSQL